MLGACRGSYYEDEKKQDVFFPWDVDYGDNRLVKARKTIDRFCSGCPVRKECFDAAMETSSEGVWGGVLITRRSKVALRRRWREGEYPLSVTTGRREDCDEISEEEFVHFL